MATFTKEDFAVMEKKAKTLLGWDFQKKFGMTIEEMVNDPEQARIAISSARGSAGFVDRIKMNKILAYLDEPNWDEQLKKALS
jgi:hypothetical protein